MNSDGGGGGGNSGSSGGGFKDSTNRGKNSSQIKVIQSVFRNRSPMLKHLFERPNQDNQTHYTLVNT